MKWILGAGLVAVLAAGCEAEDTFLDPKDYDRSCEGNWDCTVVFVGDMCGQSCEQAAISTADLYRYRQDRDAIVCPGEEPGISLCMFDPAVPVCVDGVCFAY